MKKREKHYFWFLGPIITCFLMMLIIAPATFATEVQPGTVIDASNIEQYKDYFPEFMQRFIVDGWGFEDPGI